MIVTVNEMEDSELAATYLPSPEPDVTGRCVMPTQTAAEYYREQAKLYFERATAAQNPDTRKGCEIMARQWLDLAKRAEKAHEKS